MVLRQLLAKRAQVSVSPRGSPVTVVRILRAPPDPMALARALAGRPGLAVLASRRAAAPRAEDARFSFIACDPVETSDELVPPAPPSIPDRQPAPLWIGAIPYEALRRA